MVYDMGARYSCVRERESEAIGERVNQVSCHPLRQSRRRHHQYNRTHANKMRNDVTDQTSIDAFIRLSVNFVVDDNDTTT